MERRRMCHEGFLRKSPPEHKIEKNYKWHKRFFRLWSDRTLEYYKEVEDMRPWKEPIDLRRCENAVSEDEERYKKFGKRKWTWFFKLKTPERTYHFIAPSKSEMDMWLLQINNLCMNDDTTNDVTDGVSMMNGNTSNDTPRSSSVSSRSAWSTASSSSNRSSPGVNRISPTHTQPPVPHPFQQDPATRLRIMSIPPDYRVPRSSPRSNTVSSDPRDLGYDVLTSNPRTLDNVYHVPPEPKPLITQSPKNSIKQTSTTTKIEDDNPAGYVQMTPDDYVDPYLAMDRKMTFESPGPSSEKVFKPLPFITKSQTLPQRPMHEPNVMDEIPNIKDKKRMKDLKEEPPQINRKTKPPPRVDRAKKPSNTLPPRLKLSSSTTEQEPVFQITTDTNDGMSEVHRFNNFDDPLNNYSTPRSYHNPNQSSPRKSSHDSTYLNQPITHDSRGQKITIGHSVHINLNNPAAPFDYSTEPLPRNPYEDSHMNTSSSESSSSDDVSYVNDDTFVDDGLNKGYENVKTETMNRVVRYSDVETDHWMERDGAEAFLSAASPSTITDNAGVTGTHYVFVDTTKSDAVKLTIQNRRDESRKTSLHRE